MDISTLVANQHAHFRTGATLPLSVRRKTKRPISGR